MHNTCKIALEECETVFFYYIDYELLTLIRPQIIATNKLEGVFYFGTNNN